MASTHSSETASHDERSLRLILTESARLMQSDVPLYRQAGRRIRDVALSAELEVTPGDVHALKSALAYPGEK